MYQRLDRGLGYAASVRLHARAHTYPAPIKHAAKMPAALSSYPFGATICPISVEMALKTPTPHPNATIKIKYALFLITFFNPLTKESLTFECTPVHHRKRIQYQWGGGSEKREADQAAIHAAVNLVTTPPTPPPSLSRQPSGNLNRHALSRVSDCATCNVDTQGMKPLHQSYKLN